jgi:anti-sigma factor RsiW
MNAQRHLTEAERHDAADGSLAPEQQATVTEHLAQCASCADDVARVRRLMTRVREDPTDPGVDLWPEIRSRIEREKIVQLPPTTAELPVGGGRRGGRWLALAAAGVAAALILVVALPIARGKGKAVPTAAAPVSPALQPVVDSTRAYEREATILLNELELRRAMIRPQLRSSLDHDLRALDDAILELKEAIARDPNNPALRRLLASSYKQKVDLLKRVGG